MSRFLFVVPPLAGHTNPTVGVGRALCDRGHEVAWAGQASVIAAMLDPRAQLIDVGDEHSLAVIEGAAHRPPDLRGAGALQYLWQEFLLPLGESMVAGVEHAVDEFEPDVLVVDQQALAGALVARRRRLPWATSATTSAELVDPFALMPKLADWVRDGLYELQVRHGIAAEVAAGGDLRFSDQLVLAFTTAALVGDPTRFPDHYRLVGPSVVPRPSSVTFPWDQLDPGRRRVLVSLGTVNGPAGGRFLTEATTALASMADRVQGIVVGLAQPGAGDSADADLPDVIGRDVVPQLELLPHLDAVVCHAGHNTVCEALAHGLPLVVAPIRDDQPIVAQQVCDAGAARRVKFGRVRAAELAAAITAVLDEPSYRRSAEHVRASFEQAGGAAAAADALVRLAADQPARRASTR